MVHSDYGANSYTYLFYRYTSGTCGDLGAHIEARFGWDITSGNTSSAPMTIKENGIDSNWVKNNGEGDFKFNENPIGMGFKDANNHTQYPSIQAFADFRDYGLYQIELFGLEPIMGTGHAPGTFNMTHLESDPLVNFSKSADAFHITVVQTAGVIEANYVIIGSSGNTVAGPWSLVVDTNSSWTNPPPYHHVVVSDEINGLQGGGNVPGYAKILTGTDLQIESVIRNSSLTDFTSNKVQMYNGSSNQFSITNCGLTSYVDEEGDDGTYTFGNYNVVPGSNEAYQYAEVKPTPTEQIYVTPNQSITVPVTINGVVYSIAGGQGNGLNVNVYSGNSNWFSVPQTQSGYTFEFYQVLTQSGQTVYYTNVIDIVLPSGCTPTACEIVIWYH